MTTGAPDPAVDPRPDAVRAFGRYLLRERELRGLSPEVVAGVTRLAPAVIEAIESGEPDRMPPRGYLVGYLRSYAAAVGLDPDDVVLRYQEAAGIEEPEAAAGPARAGGIEEPEAAAGPARAGARSIAAPSPDRRRLLAIVAIVAVLVAAAVAIGMRRGNGDSPEIRGRKTSERAPYRAPGAP